MRAPKLKDVLDATFYHASGVLSLLPRFRNLRLAPPESKTLGDVWANYLESVPSRKRAAVTKVLQTVAPLGIAVGATLMVFIPRLFGPPPGAARLYTVPPQPVDNSNFAGPPFPSPPPQPPPPENTAPRGFQSGMTEAQYDAIKDDNDDFDGMIEAGMGM